MQKYEAYKNSSIEWIGEIPEGWNTKRVKHLFSFGRGLNITKADLVEEGLPVISYGQIHSKYNTGTSISDELLRFVPEELTHGKQECKVNPGDFIFADTSEDKEGCGNCVYVDRKNIFAGYHSLVLKGNGEDKKYFAYLFKSNYWRSQIRAKASGVKVFSITQGIMSECTVLLPSLSEQQDIASYLDHKVGQIDASVSAINAQIDDLKAYRQSIISEAVTKGLNPDTKMKDSGIEWIGEIPEGWETSKLKFESKMVLGKMLEDKEPKDNKGEYTQEYYLKSRNIGMLEVFTDKDKLDKMWFSNKEKELYLLQKGDLVMNEGGDIGKVALWKPTDFACYIQNSVHKLTPKENLYASFLQYLISYISSTGYFMTVVSAISIAHLTKEKLAETPLLIPPLSEQRAIADYLDKKTSEIDSAISSLEAQRDDLNALKQSIISEAVTGKIDLRDWNSDK